MGDVLMQSFIANFYYSKDNDIDVKRKLLSGREVIMQT